MVKSLDDSDTLQEFRRTDRFTDHLVGADPMRDAGSMLTDAVT